ncbi:MAG: peptidase family protein [Gemmatimonadetes bacterium]|nr:peptidase family protein [Gemmatimonadota bacterium]
MRSSAVFNIVALVVVTRVAPAPGQVPAAPDSVLRAIWTEAIHHSTLESMAFSMLDSIGPRLTGSPGLAKANDWIAAQYVRWGVEAKNEQYGTWEGWQRGITHLDLLEPRVRSLDARLLAYSTGLAQPRLARVMTLPRRIDSASIASWLRDIRGNFVLISREPLSCRPAESWKRWTGEAGVAAARSAQDSVHATWMRQVMALTKQQPDSFYVVLAHAGAVALLTTDWSGGWGANHVFAALTRDVPYIGVTCEDYGLLSRLARRSTPPTARLQAEARALGPVPARNTLGVIRGGEKANETVILSAHLDSWDGGSGATDNGSGTLIVMEAMRILRAHSPRPRRTIMAAHWSGEEQGLNGSKAFVSDHSELVDGLQILFNQDNGSGRVQEIALLGFTRIGEPVRGWLGRMPHELTDSVHVSDPGRPEGATDFQSFICKGVLAIELGSADFDYNEYTWHTTIDTSDKLSFSDLRRNAAMLAMLAYLASEEPDRLPRDHLKEAVDRATGAKIRVPPCQQPDRVGRPWY